MHFKRLNSMAEESPFQIIFRYRVFCSTIILGIWYQGFCIFKVYWYPGRGGGMEYIGIPLPPWPGLKNRLVHL